MFEHVNSACVEGNGLWLPLIEYSVKTGVSLSTIRRKIKSNSIPHRLENGRYLVLHKGAGLAQSQNTQSAKSARDFTSTSVEHETDDSIRMVAEAFEHALKEKEERIQLLEGRNRELEDRLNELRVLVQVLEEKYEVQY